MKDKIFSIHPVLGIITFKDIINDLEIMLADSNLFEDVVYQLLKSNNIPNEDIASLFNLSITNRIKWIIDVLKDAL